MAMVIKSNKRMSLLLAILLAVFSTGIVIAHQCHSMQSDQVAIQANHSGDHVASTTSVKPLSFASSSNALMDVGCAVLFIVVLLLGRKLHYLRAPSSQLKEYLTNGRRLISAQRNQFIQLSLSRAQLGVIRI